MTVRAVHARQEEASEGTFAESPPPMQSRLIWAVREPSPLDRDRATSPFVLTAHGTLGSTGFESRLGLACPFGERLSATLQRTNTQLLHDACDLGDCPGHGAQSEARLISVAIPRRHGWCGKSARSTPDTPAMGECQARRRRSPGRAYPDPRCGRATAPSRGECRHSRA